MNSFSSQFISLKESLGSDELQCAFDLRRKFEERESDVSLVDPITGLRAWAEPFLALYVSVTPRGSDEIPITLTYARTRSHWISPVRATDEDCERLLQAAKPAIISDLQMLMAG